MKPKSYLLITSVLVASLLVPDLFGGPWQPVFAYGTETTAHLNLLSLYVYEADGSFSTNWKRNESKTVKLRFQSNDKSTAQTIQQNEITPGKAITRSLDFDLLKCDFQTNQEPVITLLSNSSQYLTIEVTLEDVYWTGDGSSFFWYISYPAKQLNGTMGTFPILILDETAPSDPIDEASSDGLVRPGQQEFQTPQKPTSMASLQTLADTQASVPPAAESLITAPAAPNPTVVNETSEREGQEMTPISQPAPNLIIEKYSYGADSVTAGSTFDLNIEFYNTSRKLAVENIVMSVETGEGLSIANSSNTYYFEKIGAQNHTSQTIKLKALGSDQTTSPTITVTFSYEYVDLDARQSRTSSEKIAIPVYQPDRLEITEPSMPTEIYAGNEMILTFPYVNKGKSTLYNVSATIESEIPALQKVQNLGNFEPGKSGNIDIILEPDQPGEYPLKVDLLYENASGEEIHKTFEYTIPVAQMEMPAAPIMEDPMPAEEPEQKNNSMTWILAASAITAGAAAGVVFWKKKKKKKTAEKFEDTNWFADDADKGTK